MECISPKGCSCSHHDVVGYPYWNDVPKEKVPPGTRITCTIDGIPIDDAKVQKQGGQYYICQNKKDGSSCRDKLGYKYSWVEDSDIKNIIIVGGDALMAELNREIEAIASEELKTQVKAGFRGSCLELTETGKQELWYILADVHEKALTAAAKAKVAKEKKKEEK